MRVLLRSIETGLFYEEASKWTPDQTAALDFESTARAVAYVFASRLDNVEMLLVSEDPQFNMILSIEKKPTSTPAVSSSQPEPSGESQTASNHFPRQESSTHRAL